MPFYEDLSRAYDLLFPVSPAQAAFLGRLAKGGEVRRVVDAGCGSGAQLLPFAEAGAGCVGLEPDPKMAALAAEKLAAYPGVRVVEGGFAQLPAAVADGWADLVLCLGNSLVHVPADEAAAFLAAARAALSPGGRLLLQILNYDRFRPGGETELPPMQADGGKIRFRRRYVWEGERRLRFETELSVGEPPQLYRNTIPLHPVRPTELASMLEGAGFVKIERFGDYAGSRFADDSEAIVCLARSR